MNNRTMKWLGAALLAVAALGVKAQAAGVGSPSYLNIDVTISNNLSVSVSSVRTSSYAATFDGTASFQVAGATTAVVNDSGYIAERWELTAPASSFDSATGSAGWSIATTAGVDAVKLQAVFIANGQASCATANFADPNVAPALTSATQTPYTATVLADTSLGGAASQPDNTSTNRMSASSSRALCWKLTYPTSTSYTGVQVVPVVVTAF
ncbi:MAG: hypothetical protein HY079_06010 [Elusimicrobia bacterium]|nr:hypothetical protein [Elusimicrobiota bacterium]